MPEGENPLDEAEQLLDETMSRVASTSDVARVDRRSARRMNTTIVACLLISLLSLVFGGYAISRAAAAEASLQLAKDAETAYVLAKKDLERAGVPDSEIPSPMSAQIDQTGIIKAVSAAVLAALKTDPTYRGATGLPGPAGAPGINGERGEKGDKGERGERGPAGQDCPNDSSLRPIVVKNGNDDDITIISCVPE